MIEAIDVHTHIFAPGWPDFASRFGGDRWPRLEGDPTTGCKLYLGSAFNRNLTPHAFDPARRPVRVESVLPPLTIRETRWVMIIRKDPSGALTLIGQTDHSRFVGQLAAHWGSREFEAPKPYDAVVRAATFHDYGWLRYETSPLIRPESGEPYPFLQVPMTAQQLGSYQWALDWMADIDPYSGLIISMHRTGLWRGRYGAIKHPAGRYNPATLSPEVQTFVAHNEAWQERQRATLDAKGVWTNYRLLQVWDLLGLYFGCQEPYEDHVEPVPVSYAGADDDGVRMTMKPVGPRQVAFDPYPFDVRPCRVQLAFKQVPQSTFEDVEAFRRAWFRADVGLMEFELV